MVAQGIEYIELYAGSRQSATDYLVSSLGFALVAESAADDGRSSGLLRQGDVQLLVTDGPGTSAFLAAHGDGVADIAMRCPDVAAACAAAAAAGASVEMSPSGHPVVSGFGDVCHTLYPLAAGPDQRLPASRSWLTGQLPSPSAGRIKSLDHVAICVEAGRLQEYAAFYADALGLERYSGEYVGVGAQAMDSIVVRNPSGSITFTLVAPVPGKEPGQLGAFLDRNGGPGVQHLALLVDEIIPAVRESRDRGVEFLETQAAYYSELIDRFGDLREEIADLQETHVLADRDEWGYLLQLFTRSPYERNTLFYEYIQRRGARGFGAANIRALFEAVERDRLASQ